MNFYDDDDFGLKPFDDAPPVQQIPTPIVDTVFEAEFDPAPSPSQPQAQLSSSTLANAVLNPKKKQRPYSLILAHAQMLDKLIHFRPVETFRSIEDVYRNLVVFEGNFEQTRYDFGKLGLGALEHDAERQKGSDVYFSWVKVGQFVLAEGHGKTAKVAKRSALDSFHRNAKIHCYRLEYLKPAHAQKITGASIKHYQKMLRKFRTEAIEQEIIFGTEFDKKERGVLIKFAHKLDLKAFNFGPNSCLQLKVLGLPIPALVILERILVQKDAKVCALYQVIPPRVGARRIC